jgi:stage II sporulation protein R
MINFLRNESKILFLSLVIGLLFATGVAAYTYAYAARVQQDIAENVIRFHVLAHNDDADEQMLKEYVRTKILEEFAEALSENNTIEETRENLREILPALQAYAQEIIRDAGFEHNTTADIATTFFPAQFYGDIAFPPGNYQAVQIKIGDGAGQNWWCLMFPPLCYVDMTATDDARHQLSETVSQEGFRLLTHQESTPDVVVRFRIVELWQNLLQPTPGQQQQPAQFAQQ